MKKLLTILGAIAFTASASSAVVACGSSSSSESKLKSKLTFKNGEAVVATLADGSVITVQDFLKSGSFEDYILNEVNNQVANKYASDYNDSTISNGSNTNLGLVSANRNYKIQGSNINGYESEINNFNFVSISTDLYQSYVNSLATSPLDDTVYNQVGLNPLWYENDFNNSGNFSIWYSKDGKTGFKRWTAIEETNMSFGSKTDYLPTSDELNNDKFFVVLDTNQKELPNGRNNKITEESQINKKDNLPGTVLGNGPITGQQALIYRFQGYLQSKDSKSMINSLVMEYAKNNLYKLQSAPENGIAWEKATNKSLYIDTSSTIAKDIQSWSMSSDDKITSNYKMVWRFAANSEDIDKINAAIADLVDTNKTKLVSNDFAPFKDGESIKDVFEKISAQAASSNGKNLSDKGADPFFEGTSGYQGITKDGKAVDGGTLNIDSSLTDKISKSEGFGILQGPAKNDGTPTFDQKANKGVSRDYIIVMPLYLLDILAGDNSSQVKTDSNDKIVNVAKNNWIELNPQQGDDWSSADSFTSSDFKEWKPANDDDKKVLPKESSYYVSDGKTYIFISENQNTDLTITDTSKNNKQITVSPANDADDKSGYGINGVFANPKDGSKDAQLYNGQNVNYQIHLGEGRNNPDSYLNNWNVSGQKVKDVYDLSNAKKTDLMNTLLALAAKDDTALQEETKNSIYRNYISLDDIYYKTLYDDLSKYLKEDDSTDATD